MGQMQNFSRWMIVILLIALAGLTACAPRAGTGEIAATVGSDEVVIDIPAIIIDFDSDGSASIGGLPVEMLAPGLLDQLNISAAQIQQLTALNIQHVQLNNRESGLMLLVNGLPMPSARWDDDSLANMLTTLELLDINQMPPLLADLLPLIQQVGVAVVARFPLQDGVQKYPLHHDDPNAAARISQQTQERFLTAVGHAPQINIPVIYTETGSWRVNGRTEDEYMTLFPVIPWNTLHLSAQAVQSLQSSTIAQMNIATNQEGISVSLNGKTLPYIGWSEGELQNLIALVDQTGLLEQNGITITPQQFQLISQTLLPMVQASNVNLTIQFPK